MFEYAKKNLSDTNAMLINTKRVPLLQMAEEFSDLQDVKDIALFTAPVNIMSPVLINMLHLSTTDRFIRALILYCAYYLQVSNVFYYPMHGQGTCDKLIYV